MNSRVAKLMIVASLALILTGLVGLIAVNLYEPGEAGWSMQTVGWILLAGSLVSLVVHFQLLPESSFSVSKIFALISFVLLVSGLSLILVDLDFSFFTEGYTGMIKDFSLALLISAGVSFVAALLSQYYRWLQAAIMLTIIGVWTRLQSDAITSGLDNLINNNTLKIALGVLAAVWIAGAVKTYISKQQLEERHRERSYDPKAEDKFLKETVKLNNEIKSFLGGFSFTSLLFLLSLDIATNSLALITLIILGFILINLLAWYYGGGILSALSGLLVLANFFVLVVDSANYEKALFIGLIAIGIAACLVGLKYARTPSKQLFSPEDSENL